MSLLTTELAMQAAAVVQAGLGAADCAARQCSLATQLTSAHTAGAIHASVNLLQALVMLAAHAATQQHSSNTWEASMPGSAVAGQGKP